MTLITSPHNPRLRDLRRLHTTRGRAVSGCFAAEGEDLIAAAHRAGWEAVQGYRLAGSGLGDATFSDVAPDALAAVSTLGSGTRAIGVYEQRWLQAPVGPLCVYLHGVRDPGNVGTVLRGALAFGGSCVALGPDCADPYSPKAVRASMGAVFAIGLARVPAIDVGAARPSGEDAAGLPDLALLPGERVALLAGAGEPLAALAPRLAEVGNVTLLIGAERAGLPTALVDACEHRAHIPIATDSLNAAMATTVALYEMTRRSTRVRAS